MKKLIAGLSVTLMASFSGAVEMGTGIWQQTTSGTVANNAINLGDLGLQSSNDIYLYVNVNMPLFIPDVKFRNQALVASGNGTLSITETFAGTTFNVTGDATSTLDLTYTDVVTHYGISLPLVNFDFGLNFRLVNGSFAIDPDDVNLATQSGDLAFIIPMGHVAGGAKFPGTGVSVYGEYNTLPLGTTSVNDLMVKARYKLPLPTLVLDLGIEAGYHSFDMTLGDNILGMIDTTKFASDVKSSGLFVGVSANF